MNKSYLLLVAMILIIAVTPITSADLHVPGSYSTIQAAINASDPGDQIIIAAGTYEEQLEITKSITLTGAGNSTIIKSPVNLLLSYTTSAVNKPIVFIHDVANVVLQNLKIDGFGRGNSNYRFQGVAFWNAGGSLLNCTIVNIKDTPFSGSQHGIGVYCISNNGTNRTFIMNGCSIYDFQKNATAFWGPNLTVTLTNNTITGAGPTSITAQNGIQFSDLISGTASGNTVSNISYTGSGWGASGILINPASSAITLNNNLVNECQMSIYCNSNGSIYNNTVSTTAAGVGVTNYWGIIGYKNSNVYKNTVLMDGTGSVGIGHYVYGTDNVTLNAYENSLTCAVGFDLYKEASATINAAINNNKIVSSNLCIANESVPAAYINAYGNWYNTNNEGIIITKVQQADYSPWLNSETDISADPGFQGDFSSLWAGAVCIQSGNSSKLQEAIGLAVAGGTINLTAGVFTEGSALVPQLILNKNITIQGTGSATILKPGFNTTVGGNVESEAFLLIPVGFNVTVKNIKIDCAGKQVNHAVQSRGNLTAENLTIQNVSHNIYAGRGIVLFGGTSAITNCTMSNIQRIGIHVRGNVISPNPIAAITNFTYTGKGTGDFLDYGVEIGGGGNAVLNNITAANCKGIAALDGSTSAGILITDFWGTGTVATITNSLLTNNSTGIYVGYGAADASTVSASNNNIHGNVFGLRRVGLTNVDAALNWWGNHTGPSVASNPGGTGDSVSANVTYAPWIGQAQTFNVTNSNLNDPIEFQQANTEVTFTSLPPGTNANMTVQRLTSPPSGVPNPPASAGNNSGVYLNINVTDLNNYTFTCEVVLDVSSIPGFSESTEVMYFSTLSNTWVGVDGVYDPVNLTYTFETDHFTPFAFVNPVNPDNLFISQSPTNPQINSVWYPQVGMGTGTTYGTNDWTYTNDTARFYVVPSGTTGIFGAKFQVIWDKSKANISVLPGNYWGANVMYQAIDSSVGDQGRYCFNIASNDLTNMVPDTIAGKHLAVIKFAVTKPGYIPVSITGTDFRYYHADGDSTSGVFITTNPGKLIFYLGDFESQAPANSNKGDGRINFTDLTAFSSAYWAYNTNPLYRAKYDIGPTNVNGSYWAMPASDNMIEFEDLMIFAIGYGKYAAGQLPQNLQMPVKVIALDPVFRSDGRIQIPVKLEGRFADLRGFSITMNHNSNIKYHSVEKAGEMLNGLTFLAGRENGSNTLLIDGAVVSENAINKEGVIVNVVFDIEEPGDMKGAVTEAKLRDSRNNAHLITLNGTSLNELPETFALQQNYPNPFNPVTTIKYQVPQGINVTLKIYDITGKVVETLINNVMHLPGYYSMEWNAKNYASGVYFYKIEAGSFTSVKKMMLVK